MLRLLALMLLLLPSTAFAGGSWTRQDIALELGFDAALAVDYAQTRYIVEHPAYHENNPLLDRHPSMVEVRNAVLLGAAVHYLVSDHLSGRDRTWWQAGSLAVEVMVIGHNKMIGLKASF